MVENIVANGEIDHYIQKLCAAGLSNVTACGTYRRFLTALQQTTFENIVTKGEIAQNKQFPLISQ